MSFFINDRQVGPNCPPLIIAELGINHGGSLKVAKEMVDVAKRAGVEVIKHQTHIIEDEMSSEAKKVIPGNASDSIYQIMKNCPKLRVHRTPSHVVRILRGLISTNFALE